MPKTYKRNRTFAIEGGIMAVFAVGTGGVEDTIPDGSTGVVTHLKFLGPLGERYVYADITFPSGDFFEGVLIDIEDCRSVDGLSARPGIAMEGEQ